MKGVNSLPERIPCSVIEDLLPLYIEDEVQEDTKKVVTKHLSECQHCQQIYQDMASSIFQDMDLEDESGVKEYAAEKKYLLRAKRVFLSICVIAAFIFVVFTGSSYLLGKTQGEYSERFKFAEQHDIFLAVNHTKEFAGKKITLSKILLDNSLTSIIIESELNLDYFDSITLKDNQEQFYPRAFTLFEKQYYKNANNIYTLDFVPARPEADTLILELTKFHEDDTFTSVKFEVALENRDKALLAKGYLKKYLDLLQIEISGIELHLQSLEQGISHTGLEFDLDYTGTIYDGVSFGWYPKDGVRDLKVLDLKASNEGDPLEILSIEDVTMEQLIPAADKTTVPRHANRTYRVITTPMPETATQLEMDLHNLFAFKYIYKNDLQLDFANNNSIDFNNTFLSDNYTVKLNSVIRENNKIKLYYEISDQYNQPLPEYLLDARIKVSDNEYDVAVQGRNMVEGTEHYLEFETMDTDEYSLDLLRVGFELQSGTHIIELK